MTDAKSVEIALTKAEYNNRGLLKMSIKFAIIKKQNNEERSKYHTMLFRI